MAPVAGQRLAKGERTRLHLLACTVDEIVENGPDRLGFTSIARRAGVSTGALYARYENSDELLVDVWRSVCLPAVARVVDCFVRCKTDESGPEMREVVGRALAAEDSDFVAAVSLMVVARRNEALQEDIDPSIRDLVDKATAEVPIIPHLLAYVAGSVLFERVHTMGVEDWTPALDAMAAMVREAGSMTMTPTETVTVPMEHGPRIGDGLTDSEGVDGRLFEAVVHVINRTGVDRATVSRIARRANLNPAVIYAHFEDKEHLVHQCISAVTSVGIESYRRVVAGNDAPLNAVDVLPKFFRVNASLDWETSRTFQLETTLAGGHDAVMRELLAGARPRAAAAYESVTGVADVYNMPLVWPFVVLNRAVKLGHSVLLNHGYLLEDDPWIANISRHIVTTMRNGYETTLGKKWGTHGASGTVEDIRNSTA